MRELSDLAGPAVRSLDVSARVFGTGVRPLRMPEAVFDAMFDGWRVQQASRHLEPGTIKQRDRSGLSGGPPSRGMAVGMDAAAVEEFIVDVAATGWPGRRSGTTRAP